MRPESHGMNHGQWMADSSERRLQLQETSGSSGEVTAPAMAQSVRQGEIQQANSRERGSVLGSGITEIIQNLMSQPEPFDLRIRYS